MHTSSTGTVKTTEDRLHFNGVKIFSATMAPDRDQLGEKLTNWLKDRPRIKIVDTIVTQSSDAAFHCLTITVFYWETLG